MPSADAVRADTSSAGRLLVVDDEADILRIYREFLEGQGYEVEGCSNGQDAIERIRAGGYDLVITDMVMSPVRGEEVLRAAAAYAPDVETIVITAYPTYERLQEALRRHVYDFVEKPVDLHRLSRVVQAAVAQARERVAERRMLANLRERNTQLIDEVYRTTRSMGRESLEDPVTGLLGYQAFRSVMESELSRAAQRQAPLTLGMLQLDRFREYNEALGREAGDGLLREVAAFLRASLRKTDIVFRYGSDQFAAVFLGSGSEAVTGCLERLLRRMGERSWQCRCGGEAPEVSLSAGLASAPRDGESFDELVRAADRALELARQGGKGRIRRA